LNHITSLGETHPTSPVRIAGDWVKGGVFQRMFEAVFDEPDMGYVMVDATIVTVCP
jgi:hypothetical protein